MKKKDPIYIPHQDTWTEHFPNPGSNKNDYTLYLSDPQAQYNKLLRTQQKLRNKKKWIIYQSHKYTYSKTKINKKEYLELRTL